jgi:cytochrome c oxidase subunit 1
LPEVHRWAYDYSVPGAKEDFIPQNHKPDVDEPEHTTGEHA